MAISGSTRNKSTNETILYLIANWFSENLDVHIYKEIAELPHFNPDITDEQLPAAVKEFRALVDKADGVIICTPEYVSTTVFSHKPMALIVASTSGEKAFEALKLIMGTIEAIVSEESSLLIRGAKGKFSREGEVLNDKVGEDLKMVVKALINMISKKKKVVKI